MNHYYYVYIYNVLISYLFRQAHNKVLSEAGCNFLVKGLVRGHKTKFIDSTTVSPFLLTWK